MKKFDQGPCPGKPGPMTFLSLTPGTANPKVLVAERPIPEGRVSFHPDTLMDRIVPRFFTLLAIGTIALSVLACGGDESLTHDGETISRARFVETYVELRKAGLRSRQMDLTLDEQRAILERTGVTEEDLLAFVEYWGTNGDVMLGIWEEVDSIMRETRVAEGELEEEMALDEEEEEGGDRRDPVGTEGGEGGGSP